MARNRYRNNSLKATIKDYLVPIIGWVLIIILLYSFFSWDSSEVNVSNENENRTPTDISFSSIDTQATIVYPWDTKEDINDSYSLFKGESIIVKEGSVILDTPNWNNIHLNKIAELKLEEDGSYSLYSSDAWFTLSNDADISMSYANISAPAGSIIALTQNEANSTIYVLSGSAKVTNLAGVNTLLIRGQKISVSRQDAANKDADLAGEKSSIDSYFKGSDWFIANNGHTILEQETNSWEETQTGSTSQEGASGTFVSFNELRDEMSTDKSSLDISGTILSDEVWSVTINNAQVSIAADRSFSLSGLNLNGAVSDIVVKIYNTNRDILEKKVYTVYSSARISSTSTTTTSSPVTGQWVTTYEVDATKFGFTEPSDTGKFSTTLDEITIRWYTSAEGITQVQVNGFVLSSFNGSTWRYHAFKRFETLEEGTNQYRVDYFWENGNIVYTDYYTIVKKTATATDTSTTPTPETSTSQEWTEEASTTESDIPDEWALFAE